MRKALLALLLLLSVAYPAINGLELAGSIDPSGTAHMKMSAEFQSSEGKAACINVSAPVDEVTVRDRSGLILPREVRAEGNATSICAVVPADYLEYELNSSSFTAKNGPLWEYDLALGASMDIGRLNATISLPQGATLKGTNGEVTSAGDALAVSWSADGIDTQHRARMKASYELASPQPQQDYTIVAISLSALLLAAFFAIKRLRPPQKGAMPGKDAGQPAPSGPSARVSPATSEPAALESNPVFRTLDETDKELVREISRQGGKTTQAHLNLQTHVPKATLSRRLASLESKGIIRKSQKGNRNLVTLTDILRN